MKAPETIFLHGYSFDDEPCKNWTLEPFERGMRGYAVQNEKYIRKDALLEWAKNLKEKWEEPPMSRHSPGCVFMLEQVIKKLNSM